MYRSRWDPCLTPTRAQTLPLHVDAHELVLLRGNLLTFLSNRGSRQRGGTVVKVNVPGLQRGDVLVQVLGAQTATGPPQHVVVGKEGIVRIIIRQGLPQVCMVSLLLEAPAETI